MNRESFAPKIADAPPKPSGSSGGGLAARSARPYLPLLFLTFAVIVLFAVLPTTIAAAQAPIIRPPVKGDAQMADIASRVVPYVKDVVERLTLRRFIFLATILAQLVMAASFIRLMIEHPGVTRHFFNWSGRWIFFLPLIVLGPFLVSYLWQLGQVLTTPLLQPVAVVRQTFDERYRIYVRGNFLAVAPSGSIYARINGNNDLPRPDSGPGVLIGVLRNDIPDAKSIEEMLKDDKKNLPTYFGIISVGRGVILFVDFILVAISGFLMIAFRLAVPWMCAVGGDKQLANEVTYRFARGVIVYTLVYPVVANIMRIIAYLFGLVGMSSYSLVMSNTAPGFGVTPGGILPFPYDPAFSSVYALGIAGFFMLVTALCLAASPVIAWKIAFGETFQGVSSITSAWMAGITGSAMNFMSAKLGAALNYDAERAMVNAHADAGIIGAQAEARRDVTMQQLGAQKETTGIRAAAQNAVTLNNAATTKEVRGFQAQLHAEIKSNNANNRAAREAARIAGDSSVNSTNVQIVQQQDMADVQQFAQNRILEEQWTAQKWGAGGGIAGAVIGRGRAGSGGGGGVGGAGHTGAQAGGLIGQKGLIETQMGANDFVRDETIAVTNKAGAKTINNTNLIVEQQQGVEDVRYTELNRAVEARTGTQTGAALGYNVEANQAAREYADVQVGAAEAYARGAGQATRERLGESVRAIETIRRAGERAAEDHRMAQILSQLTNDVARRVEETGAYRGF